MNTIDRIKHAMDICTAKCLRDIHENGTYMERVYEWLCDLESKVAYEKELALKSIVRVIVDQDVIRLLNPIPPESFQPFLEKAKVLDLDGELPHIAMPDTTSEYHRYYALTTTFLVEQYTYAPHVGIRQGDVFLDCGACYGETSIWACMQGAAQCYAFEPSPIQQKYLKKNIAHHSLSEKVFPLFSAVGKASGSAYFQQNTKNAAASTLSDMTETSFEVPVVDIDTWCAAREVKPDFIKMDLEGGEMDALLGAERTIRECKPRLAICLYHRPSDMWSIPYFIKKISPDYALWCRKNAHDGEFVLYACSQEHMYV